jgi:hypothetical protein
MEKVLVEVMLRYDLDKLTQFETNVVHLSVPKRLTTALKSLLICLAIAVLCVFIPVLHFVLVPLAVLVGLVIFYLQMTPAVCLVNGTITCPNCEKQFAVGTGPFRWPKHEVCPHCKTEMNLEVKLK